MKLTREDMLLCIDLIDMQGMDNEEEIAAYKDRLREGLDYSEELVNMNIKEIDDNVYEWLYKKLRGESRPEKLNGFTLSKAMQTYNEILGHVCFIIADNKACRDRGKTSLFYLVPNVHMWNALKRAKIHCIEDLGFLREPGGYDKLRSIRGFGKVTMENLVNAWSDYHGCRVSALDAHFNSIKNKQITLDQALQKIAAGYSTGELQLQQYATQDNYKALRAFLGLSENTNANSALEFLDSMEV